MTSAIGMAKGMNDVERFAPGVEYCREATVYAGVMNARNDGHYVRYTDYNTLQQQLAAAREELSSQAVEIERLRTEIGILAMQVPSAEMVITRCDVEFYRGALEACKANRAEILARAERAERASEEMREELAELQVIHNCLRRDHDRSKEQVTAAGDAFALLRRLNDGSYWERGECLLDPADRQDIAAIISTLQRDRQP